MLYSTGQHWPAFLKCVERNNAFCKPGVLRHYQGEILERGAFDVTSPFSGVTLPVRCSVRLGRKIAYAFDCSERFWLVTEHMRFGHPLSIFVHDATGDCVQIRDAASLEPAAPAPFLEALRKADQPTVTPNLPMSPILLIGHGNFAHHLWNELAALDYWLSEASDEAIGRLQIFTSCEPLGPLREIFPRLKRANFVSDDEYAPTGLSRPIFVRAGSSVVTNNVRKAVLEFSRKCADQLKIEKALRVLDSGWPRVWISLRVDSRTAENQDDFLMAVLRRIFDAFPEAVIVFDSFSFPNGFFGVLPMERSLDKFVETAAETARAIEFLMLRAIAELGPGIGARLCNISACSLADAFLVGAHCDYYVCHAGTLQHKIAWLHNVPGFVHSPSHVKSYGKWCANQVECGIAPDMLPGMFIRPTGIVKGRKRDALRNQNYIITDVERSAEAVVRSMQKHLGKRGKANAS